eukprot:scaffold4157_cov136-Cylindrotheca_fusiformis.AAC.37
MKKPVKSVVVVRHGERLDYTMRDRGENWIPTTDRPWDPPLTDNGRKIANALGVALPEILESLKLPPIGAVYSSPFHRCRQTASELCALNDNVKVRVEPALCESISENWFRSWASSGTDGSWGYGKKDYPDVNKLDPETLHPLSRQPVQPLLEWKQGVSDSFLEGKMDPDYVSKTSIDIPYSLYPANLENYDIQRKRMHDALNLLSDLHKDETIVLVSHDGKIVKSVIPAYRAETGRELEKTARGRVEEIDLKANMAISTKQRVQGCKLGIVEFFVGSVNG